VFVNNKVTLDLVLTAI